MQCQCAHCEVVKSNSENNIWIHNGRVGMKPDEFNNTEIGTSVKFIQPIHRPGFNGFGTGDKPKNVIWFSNGSWLFDPYCDGCHEEINTSTRKAIVIKSPKNILSISTRLELEMFINKYLYLDKFNRKYYYDQSHTEYICDIIFDLYNYLAGYTLYKIPYIRWDDICADGYWGLSFNFRKWYHLYYDEWNINKRYNWHDGYDVESLMIFDTRAIDNASIEMITI